MKSTRQSLAGLGGLIVACVVGVLSVPIGPFGILTTFGAVIAFRSVLSPWVEAGKS